MVPQHGHLAVRTVGASRLSGWDGEGKDDWTYCQAGKCAVQASATITAGDMAFPRQPTTDIVGSADLSLRQGKSAQL